MYSYSPDHKKQSISKEINCAEHMHIYEYGPPSIIEFAKPLSELGRGYV